MKPRNFKYLARAKSIVRERELEFQIPCPEDIEQVVVGVLYSTRKVCSCRICGNPRKYYKTQTLAECKANISFKEQLKEQKYEPRVS